MTNGLSQETVTFLFTDIEGSTKLWERHEDAMRVALSRHDELLRSVLETHGGRIFKTVGDAFCAAFAAAPNALSAALEAQCALQAETWPEPVVLRVRFSLHTGAAERRDNDYFGPPLNRVARLLAIGYGGQILLTQATYELTRDSLLEGVELRDLDFHRLKDLQRPERVYQLVHPDLPDNFGSLKSLDPLANNLPVQATSFIGREKEVREVRDLLRATRLLTLTGAGGAGKTRLALQVAADLLEGEGEGVWLVEFAPIADPALIPQVVAQVLGVREETDRPLIQTLVDHLKTRKLLLLFDNCEHVIAAVADLAHTLLRACPGVQILASSREGLNIPGETAYRVPSLSLPDPLRVAPTPESLSQYEAVRLFIERAQAALASFTVTSANAPAVAQLCYRLDGIPLALELAAARVRALSVEQIAARLDDRFRLLTGGSRTLLPRHQTLRAAMDWSYDLLTPEEQTLLRHLSVFAGGWTLEAAEQSIGALPVLSDTFLMDDLSRLVEKSLVVFDEVSGSADRYRLLETVRQYGDERLEAEGDRVTARRTHRDWFLNFAEQANSHMTGTEQAHWFTQMEVESANLNAAVAFTIEEETSPSPSSENRWASLRFIAALQRFWEVRGSLRQGREQCTRLLKVAGSPPEDAPPPSEYIHAIQVAGSLAQNTGAYEDALRLQREALSLAQRGSDPERVAWALGELAIILEETGNAAEAKQYQQEAITLLRSMGPSQENGVAIQLSNLGVSCLSLGDYAGARTALEEALAIQRRLGDTRSISIALNNLGDIALDEGDPATALRLHRESLQLAQEIGARRSVAYVLESLAAVAVVLRNAVQAARLGGAAEALREILGAPLPPSELAAYSARLDDARALLPPSEFAASWDAGRALTYEAVVAEGLSFES